MDYGTAVTEVPTALTTKALELMVVGMSSHFKHIIAYMLQDKHTASVQSQIIKDCIKLLHCAGMKVLALGCDGCFRNQSTARLLGCKMKMSRI